VIINYSNPIPLYPPSPSKGEGGRIFKRGTKFLFNTLCPCLKREGEVFKRGKRPSYTSLRYYFEEERGV
jgi:hypothetical protein